ncbi:MAG: ribonuclease HI family protein [Promethearchaeota archaeon]
MRKYKINPIKEGDILEIYVDGASRGNMGPSSCAFIFVKGTDIIYQNSEYIGEATNNIAEYQAIINALKEAEKFSRWHLKVYSDSELVIRQINKIYRIKAKHLSQLCAEVYGLCGKYKNVEFFHVNREHHFIKKSDELCNKYLNEKGF